MLVQVVLGHASKDGRYLGENVATGEVVCYKSRWGQSERWTIVDAREHTITSNQDYPNYQNQSEGSYFHDNISETRPIKSCDPIGQFIS